jgi:hypothetical protein
MIAIPPAAAGAEEPLRLERAEERKVRLRKALEAGRFSGFTREELAARIERRLIINESQLHDAVIKQEKLEARNLDYPGKAVIAKQALTHKSLLEIVTPAPRGGEKRVFGIPTALEKNGGETILVLRPVSRLPGDNAGQPAAAGSGNQDNADLLKIPLGKISLIRRIKQSLFEE